MAKFESEADYLVLGEVGTFNILTLKDMNKQIYPSPIEEDFVKRVKDYNRKIEELKSYKIGIFCKLQDVYWRIHELESLQARKVSLIDAIQRYYTVFPNRKIKGRPSALFDVSKW